MSDSSDPEGETGKPSSPLCADAVSSPPMATANIGNIRGKKRCLLASLNFLNIVNFRATPREGDAPPVVRRTVTFVTFARGKPCLPGNLRAGLALPHGA